MLEIPMSVVERTIAHLVLQNATKDEIIARQAAELEKLKEPKTGAPPPDATSAPE